MNEALEMMKWPLVACVLLPGILVYFGLHIVRREIIFVDLALAQVAALGICMAILLGYDAHDWQTKAWSGSFTLAGAIVLTLIRPSGKRIPHEALIGIVYVVAAAAGFLLLSKNPGGDEELRKTMVGEILLVQSREVFVTFSVFVGVALFHLVFRRKFHLLSFAPDSGREQGMRIWLWDFLFYVSFGVVVTSFVSMAGVLLVFSYLIIPAVCASLFAKSFRVRIVTGWVISVLFSILGLYCAYVLDLPTGAAIICALGIALLLSTVASKCFIRG